MFKQFILWLVTKLLTPRDRLQLVVDDGFLANPRRTIDNLYHVAHSNKHGVKFESFDRVSAKRLSEFDISGSVYIAVLFALHDKLIACTGGSCFEEEVRNFFHKVNTIKGHGNRLKVSKDLFELVRKETLFANEQDINLVAHVLQHQYIDTEATTKFLTNTGV
ncbi:hypothetical protein ST201phi2-1p278 [Pseudomonas phage 201phi2-1]|uniref:Uncharacterized protein n=1 Tax=Pseudomonas phage 201phi2-1 TaxID=198110 RepID=B3FJD9_BP201|nr:hypothetical protein ST201phi2-1p278 [Pseudomonas phage 201phi2-1]ABY63105.1 hypothetical protein 201phi2-1p278 [Pseudomonas phage 201phi2-1]